MSLIINHNISALNTHRNIVGSGQSMAKSIEKLSSGYKINVGADDPSGLIISEQLRSQISGLERAVRNSSEAFNLIGIAEGALNEMNTILKKMRALAIHAANSGVTSPEQVAADQSEMDSGIETLNRIANTTRYSDQYLLNGQKQLVYDVTTSVNEPTDHSLLDTKMTRIDQVFKRDGVKMSIGFTGEKSQYQANTDTSAQRAYLEADNAYSLSEIDGDSVTANQEFILTGTSGSRLFSFTAGAHLGEIVSGINNVRDSTGIGASLTFASDVRIDQTVKGTREPMLSPDYSDGEGKMATPVTGYDDGTYIYQSGDVQIYGAGLNNVNTAKISEFTLTPDAAGAFKVGYNCDGDGKIYAKVVDKSTNAIEYYKDRNCTMLVGKGDSGFFAATNNSGIPSSPINNLDGIFMKLNTDNAQDLDVFEIAVVGQRLDNQKDMNVSLAGWSDTDNSVMSGVNLGVNTSSDGGLFYEYVPLQFESDGKTVKNFEINVYMHESREPKYLVATSGTVENNLKVPNAKTGQLAGQTVRIESVMMDDGTNSGLNITLNLPKAGTLDSLSKYDTVEEMKASPEYVELMEKLSTEQRNYAEIEDKYVSARDARDVAREALADAQRQLNDVREKEAQTRREIDRIEVRSIGDQMADATNDLVLAQNDILSAARDAIGTKAFEDAEYRNVTAASPGAPEVIAERMAKEVLKEIERTVTAGGDPTVTPDWEDPAVRDSLMAIVKNAPPLAGMKTEYPTGDPIWDDVDALLEAAYGAATDIDLVREVGDFEAKIDQLDGLEAKYQAELKRLNDSAADLDNALYTTLDTVDKLWAAKIPGAALPATAPLANAIDELATAIQAQLTAHIDGTAAATAGTGAADDSAINFYNYNWSEQKDKLLADAVLNAAFETASSYAGGSATEKARWEAIASDVFDSITASTELAKYGEAVQDLKDNPQPTAADPSANRTLIIDETQKTIDTILDDMPAGLKAAIDTINLAPPAGFSWSQLGADIAKIMADTLETHGVVEAGLPADLITAVKTVTDGIIAANANNAAYQALSALLVGGPGLIGAAQMDGLASAIVTAASGAGSTARDFVLKDDAYKKANAAWLATTAAGGLEAVTVAGSPANQAALDANASVVNLNDYADDAVVVAPATGTSLTQEIADSLAEEMLLLAEDGVTLNLANLSDARTRDAMIARIYDGIPADMKGGDFGTGATPGIGEAALKQFISEVYDTYIGNGVAQNPAAAVPGSFTDYADVVGDYAAVAEIYPGGGSLPRALDRLARYEQRIKDAPAGVENSSMTRNAWDNLVSTYGGQPIQDELEKLAKDFGEYVFGKIESASKGNPIVWNSDTQTDDIYDELNKMAQDTKLWDKIQADIAAGGVTKDTGDGMLRDFQKVVDRMFTSVTNPEYLGDIAELDNPPPELDSDYPITSLAQRYFDQVDRVAELREELDAKINEKDGYDSVIEQGLIDVSTLDEDGDGEPDGELVMDLHVASEEFGEIAEEADPILDKIAEYKKEMKDMLEGAKSSRSLMPPGNQTGAVNFINLGMRIYSVDYGSMETIRIQNKAGNLFYQYREADSMEKLMVEPDKTVQVAGQDAQIALNGAPVFTTGLVADTTTPDFSGSLVFNAGTLGETSLAVTGYDVGKLFSKATALQGVEEDEAQITELRRSFEPPSVAVLMGDKDEKVGMLNENGSPVNLYMDFSQFDPSVEVKIANLQKECDIKVEFHEPDQLTINADSLGGTDIDEGAMTITVKVNPGDLKNGYYVTDPALKGLFIRTDVLVDLNVSGGDYALVRDQIPSTVPSSGNTMLEVNTFATNPRKNTSESMENFLGGMQFQLGNTEGDQDRTVYSIQSMAMSELGRISWNGTEYCLQNVLGGGVASLSKDPILAMRILEQAVNDVSTLRARLGAFQSNMLQSNINSLGVAIENITKTESAIRDTDMAEESTQFTRFQIMQQAGTSMLAQANQVSQNVLSLLQ